MIIKILFFTLLTLSSPFCAEINPLEFQNQVQKMVKKFPELSYIQKTAARHGLKVYLFGGSASSFAHYVKENMLFEQGSDDYYTSHFQESGGERDITTVFRPTQDVDLVVDGNLENVAAFEQEILNHLPNIRGDSKSWEIRSLREDYRDKIALLQSFDFLNQHTDSHSIGLVALSDVESGKVVRDLREWDNPNPSFLQDILENKLHYYYKRNP